MSEGGTQLWTFSLPFKSSWKDDSGFSGLQDRTSLPQFLVVIVVVNEGKEDGVATKEELVFWKKKQPAG